jgi:hypothetical protein
MKRRVRVWWGVAIVATNCLANVAVAYLLVSKSKVVGESPLRCIGGPSSLYEGAEATALRCMRGLTIRWELSDLKIGVERHIPIPGAQILLLVRGTKEPLHASANLTYVGEDNRRDHWVGVYVERGYEICRSRDVFVFGNCGLSNGSMQWSNGQYANPSRYGSYRGAHFRVLASCWDNARNLYHLTHDMICHIFAMPSEVFEGAVAVFPAAAPVVNESMAAIGVTALLLAPTDFVFAGEVIYVSGPNYEYWCPSAGIMRYREVIRRVYGLSTLKPELVRFVPREGNVDRIIANGEELVETLDRRWPTAHWFSSRCPRGLEVAARFVAAGAFTLAPHGAFLTHVVLLAHTGTGYGEIRADISGWCFANLAQLTGVKGVIARCPGMRHTTRGTSSHVVAVEKIVAIGEAAFRIIVDVRSTFRLPRRTRRMALRTEGDSNKGS